MIPNAGLDNIAAYPAWQFSSGPGNPTSGQDWLAYAAISEDSSEPTASDTNIGTEAMRTNSTGGFSISATAIRDPNTNRLGISVERAYVFNIMTELNITKYGYVPLSSGGNFSWIDLMRVDPDDPGSAPVTLNLVPGDQLQLWRTLTITVPWSVDLEQFVITGAAGKDGAGTHDAYCGFYSASATLTTVNNDGLADMIRQVFWPGTVNILAVATAQAASTARDESVASSTTGESRTAAAAVAEYVSGTYYRDKLFTFTTAQGNMSITGIAFGRFATTMTVTASNGFKIVFDDPSTFTKANTHELTLTFRVSWQEG